MIPSLLTQPDFSEPLSWLDQQSPMAIQLLIDLCNQNSGTFNAAGVDKVVERLRQEYVGLSDTITKLETPPARLINDLGQTEIFPLGPTLQMSCRDHLPRKIFLCIHADTVYGPEHEFQSCCYLDDQTLNGPGVIDAKGGQVVMLLALRAFERSPLAKRMGWRVLINPDEEIGSLGSSDLLKSWASGCECGLLFEPVLPDGSMVAARRGSGNFTLVCRGRSAHAGRDFSAGRNAVVHLARCIDQIDRLNGGSNRAGAGGGQQEGRNPSGGNAATFNVGKIQGGGPVNMVPDLAVARLNIRVDDEAMAEQSLAAVHDIVRKFHQPPDFELTFAGVFSSPPKVVDPRTRQMQQRLEIVAPELNLPISWRNTGGASDGNKLAGIGIPNIDTMGPAGNHLHSPQEYLIVSSLVERAKFTAATLLSFAAQAIDWK